MRARRLTAAAVAVVLTAAALAFGPGAGAAGTPGRYIVMFKEQADLTRARSISNLNDRRRAIFEVARDTAERTQVGVLDVLAKQRRLGNADDVKSLQIVNAVTFRGQTAVADAIRARPEVQSVSTDEVVRIPSQFLTNRTNLWNITMVRAREVWDQGISGAGITIANIDTGVQANHPALKSKYRGAEPTGWTNEYNWFDPVGFSNTPYDDNGHGTHAMGIAVGGEGPAPDSAESIPDIGLAYGAKWIAAKAFDSQGAGLTSNVLLAMQWMQWPRDTQNGSPRFDKAPDIVANSWSADGGCRAWFAGALTMWRAASILPVFSVGHDGSPRSPGDLTQALSVGATDDNDVRAGFSAQGPACLTSPTFKPEIHAPGVGIYSSNNQSGYVQKNGTSASVPHVAGGAALMLQAAGGPGSLWTTTHQIDDAIVATAANCTGTTGGPCKRLDVAAAVAAVRQTGVIRGLVKSAATSAPIEGARISIVPSGVVNPVARTVFTDRYGMYTFTNVQGTFDVSAKAYSFQDSTVANVVVPAATTVTVNFNMSLAPVRAVEGHVTLFGSGDPAPGATVKIEGTPLSTTTDATGFYSLLVPDPTIPDSADPAAYDYVATYKGDNCHRTETRFIVVKDVAPNIYDVVLDNKRDTDHFGNEYPGYTCEHVPFEWQGGSTILPLRGDDVAAQVNLPFPFPFYERNVEAPDASPEAKPFTSAFITDNGTIRFDYGGGEYYNMPIPDMTPPNAAVYGFWDDLRMDTNAMILTNTTSDTYTVEWRNMTFHHPYTGRITFSITLHRNGDIDMRYQDVTGTQSSGISATIGLENIKGTVGFAYSHNEGVVKPGLQVSYTAATRPGILKGTVTGTGAVPLAGASVTAVSAGNIPRTTTTNSLGQYRVRLQEGAYSVTASKFHYASQTKPATLTYLSTTVVDFNLTLLPGFNVTGTVKDSVTNSGVVNMPVSLNNPSVPNTATSATGQYQFSDIPPGNYLVETKGSGRCRSNPSAPITVSSSDVQQDLVSVQKVESGYRCEDNAPLSWIPGTSQIPLTGTSASSEVSLPFAFPIFDKTRDKVKVAIDGYLSFDTASSDGNNTAIPSSANPNLTIYPFWDDLVVKPDSSIWSTLGSNYAVIEWRNVEVASEPGSRISFEVILYDDGNFDMQYQSAPAFTAATGTGATVGLENFDGNAAFTYSLNTEAIRSGLRIQFIAPGGVGGPGGGGGSGTAIAGKVTEEPLGTIAIANVNITLTAGAVSKTGVTNLGGEYNIAVAPGTYTLFASKNGYQSRNFPVTVGPTGVTLFDFRLSKLPIVSITGQVVDQVGGPIPGFQFQVCCSETSSRIPVTTVATGHYSVTGIPAGTYTIEIRSTENCQKDQTITVVALEDAVVDITVELPRDAFGHTCLEGPLGKIHADIPIIPYTPLLATGPSLQDVTRMPVPLNFEFPLYETKSRIAWVGSNGTIRFDKGGIIELATGPVLNVFKDPSLRFDSTSQLMVRYLDQHTTVIEWRNALISATAERITFEVVLRSSGEFQYQYATMAPGLSNRTSGGSATIGIENSCGSTALNYSVNEPGAVKDGLGIFWSARFDRDSYVACS